MFRSRSASLLLFLLVGVPLRAIVGEPNPVRFQAETGAFPLATGDRVAPVWVDPVHELAGVRRAAADLVADLGRVTQRTAAALSAAPAAQSAVVLAGTLGHSAPVDRLVREGRINVSAIRGHWEAWLTQTVDHPFPGVDRAFVIVGSDKRGTIYGLYDLAQQIGVSPWSWWDDVPVPVHRELYVQAGRTIHPSPAVKYRGIFLNDEAPDLTNWVKANYGTVPVGTNPPVPPGVANYDHRFYARLFELMLRLRANYLWPAMWNNAFNEDDPANAKLADEYGIVMGTSHQEPMLRAQKEWDRRYKATLGAWNYAKEPQQLEDFWTEGIKRNRAYESIITLGLRGADDTPMAPGGPAANRALLEHIVARQREILRTELNPVLTEVPQVWCLYKEVVDFYDAGMRVPDDVTLLWPDDNWGNLRRLPTAAERKRTGGAGIYYHFDYHGDPRSYQWVNTTPLPKIWEQMSWAAQAGATQIWIVNVGHFKGYEVPTEFFLDLAWNPERWTAATVRDFTRGWAAREFGPEQAPAIADLFTGYSFANARRKPELLAPGTYSLVNYREAETVVADYDRLAAEAERVGAALPEADQAAFAELVGFPTRESAVLNELYLAAARNALYAAQGRVSANAQLQEVQRCFERFQALIAGYNALAGGKWAHFMDQPVLGYTSWRDPPLNSLKAIPLVSVPGVDGPMLGVAVEGSAAAWPGTEAPPRLPPFDSFSRPSYRIDVFNRGRGALSYQASSPQAWIKLSANSGAVTANTQVTVSIDWSRLALGRASGSVMISGGDRTITVQVVAIKRPPLPGHFHGFVESSGYIACEAEHYSRRVEDGLYGWINVPGDSRTLSGLRAETGSPPDAKERPLKAHSARLEYRMYLYSTGTAEVTALTAPSLNFVPGRGLRYAVSWDNDAPAIVELVPAGYKGGNGNAAWAADVADNVHHSVTRHLIARPGEHVLKIWMVDPAVVLQKVVVDLGGVKPSYLGPPESYRVR